MTTAAIVHNNRSSPMGLFLLVIVVIVGLLMIPNLMGTLTLPTIQEDTESLSIVNAITVDMTRSHAVLKHGDDAIRVRSCIDSKGIQFTLKIRPSKWINVCQLDSGEWGFQVMLQTGGNKVAEITAYIREELTDLKSLVDFCVNKGISLVTN